jgi:hypothetical protein
LPDEVKGSTADGDVKEIGCLFVEDARIGEGSHKQDGTAEGEGPDKVAKHDSRRLDANLDVIPAILARVDGV